MAIEVHPQGELIVRSPNRLSLREIEEFLHSRKKWIDLRLKEVENARKVIPELLTEQHFHHRGDVLHWDKSLSARNRWQRAEAEKFFGEVIGELLPKLGSAGLKMESMHLRKMRRRWGSCSSTGKITLNEYLIRVPDNSIRAVIAHELAHLVHMNHGRRFQALARKLFEGYDEANAELDRWTAILPEPMTQTKSGTQGPAEKRTIWFTD